MDFPKTKNHNSKEKAVENILYEKYNSYYRMAMSYVHNESDAMDIVQEGAYKAIKNSNSLKLSPFFPFHASITTLIFQHLLIIILQATGIFYRR